MVNHGRTVFAQVMDAIPHPEFQKCVERYRGGYKVKKFSCLDQFLSMAFAQFTYRDSLRDLVTCLNARSEVLYHMGIRTAPTRNNLANANAQRDWRIYADFAMVLIQVVRDRYGKTPIVGLEINEPVYALDSTTIDLCLNLFQWAKFRKTKAAVKLHTLLDLHCAVPVFINISDGKLHDVNILDDLPIEPGAYYVMDRGYLDYARLYAIHQQAGYFVTRAKRNLDYRRVSSAVVDKGTGLRADQIVRLRGPRSRTLFPEPFRRIVYRDPDTGKRLVFLTNITELPALVIARLYKSRWQIELFFKWLKQNLRIRQFFGTSANAVKTQVWIAVCVYVLVVITHRAVGTKMSMSQMLQVLSVSPFEKVTLAELLTDSPPQNPQDSSCNQLMLNI